MGTSESKPSVRQPAARELNQQLIERLRALDVESKQRQTDAMSAAEKGYVFVDDSEVNQVPLSNPTASASKDVSIEATQIWEGELLKDPKNRLALSAFTNNPASSIVTSRAASIADTQTFNVTIPQEGSPVTNQRASGRCWLFASTNVFRIALMRKYNLAHFELSQAYLFFWDKLEKANYFLESVLDTAADPLDGRLVQQLLAAPVGDGGQWDMVANLVAKYGLLPHHLYPDSVNAASSAQMAALLTAKLREQGLQLRRLAQDPRASSGSATALSAAKHAMLRDIHSILTLMLGPPPPPDRPFTWEHYDRAGKYRSVTTTPLQFAAQLSDPASVRACGGTDVHRLFSLTNDPRNAYNTLLTVQRLGNVYGARPVTYVNVSAAVLKEACVAMLRRGFPVFFGCDVGKYSDGVRGVMDTALYDYELGFNVRLGMSKAERLQTRESAMTHAMVLTGVQVESEGGGRGGGGTNSVRGAGGGTSKTIRWRVENSWSDERGDKGYFVMTDAWMDEYVYQAVVDPGVVSGEVRDVLGMRPKVLPLWDPMGALA